MFRKISMFLAVGTLILGLGSLSFAMTCGDMGGPAAQPASKESVNAGNKICPVTSEKIDEKTKVTYEYQGRVYNLCCPMCIEDFKKDPEKYIRKVNEELKAQNK